MTIRLADNLTLPTSAVTETFGILANRGKGKSNAATVLVEQMHAANLQTVVLDVKGDWWGIRSSADGRSAGLPLVIFGGDHPDVPLEPTAGALLAGARTMLDTLIDRYPQPMSRTELADAVQMTVTGGTFNTYLGDLRRNGLVDVHGPDITASDILFLGASA